MTGQNGVFRRILSMALTLALLFSCIPAQVFAADCAHNYEAAVTAPTCAAQGYTTHTCTACGDSFVDCYVEPTGHSHENGICTECGTEHPNLANYEGKVISILGESISTFSGYIPVADGFNLAHRSRYPQSNLLMDVNETWWMQLITQLDARLGINDSWAGSQVLNTINGNSGDVGEKASQASVTRIQNLGANGTPDIILFYGAGNDMRVNVPLGTFDPASAPAEVDLKTTKWNTFAEAYTDGIMRLQYFYPDTEIVVMLHQNIPAIFTNETRERFNTVIRAICAHYGVTVIDMADCGITEAMTPDGSHPNAEGMDLITECAMEQLLEVVDLEPGENVVYPITQNLTNATASLSYYKGVSHGRSFSEKVSGGGELDVTVMMGGKDITDGCYADGMITIPEVTGELVITVNGDCGLNSHLQQLPEKVCCGTNLWTVLEPENIYYTANGWGNLSTNTTYSVTFPVSASDQIWASSIGNLPENGKGTRVTWFGKNGVLKSVSRDEVYAEYLAYGYITAPEGAVALNVPMPSADAKYEIYILNRDHRYTDSICEICGTENSTSPDSIYAGYLQQLPEHICSGTNLWTVLEPENIYYTANGWGNLSTNTTYSVTFPVSAGDQIWASSIGNLPENGKGTRVTWFGKNGVLKSVSRDEVYAEYLAYGYITAPEGAVALNVPMPSADAKYEIYILNLNHDYSDGICCGCGKTEELNPYQGKVISIMGDSISTFSGYIPVIDGFNLAHKAFYPNSTIQTVDQTWWMQVISGLDAKLGINESWAGSQVLNQQLGNEGDLGEDAAMASMTRTRNLGANGTPDIILFFGGTNDIGRAVPMGSFDPNSAPDTADLMATRWDTFADAYVAAILRMQYCYPDALLLAMIPYETTGYYTKPELEAYAAVMRAICEHYGITYVDLRQSQINTGDLTDGIHPTVQGMEHIAAAVKNALCNSNALQVGATTVYKITHDLVNVTGSLGYYKGINGGRSFTEVLDGENMTVTVKMGGKDVTDSVYQNGTISIPSVTADVVITARGDCLLERHLQQLPQELCPETNIWNLLKPEQIYYTAKGWGYEPVMPDVHSVTFPVIAGDQIWASSFGYLPESGNGTRITWFGENGVLRSVPRSEVYAEFLEKGYVTAPEGAIALNVPMPSADGDYEIYIQNRKHPYESVVTAPTCTEQGYTTHTCTFCGYSYVDSYTDRVPLKILMIGNSFTWDAADAGYGLEQSQMYQTIQSMLSAGYSVQIGVLVKGSSTLSYHATCARDGTAGYKYAEIGPHTGGIWSPTSGGSETNAILTVLEKENWDIITVQAYEHEADDGTTKSGSYVGGAAEFASPADSIPYLLDYFARHEPGAEVYYYMPWASAKLYGTEGMAAGYEGIAAYTERTVMDYKGEESGRAFAGIVPVGTGIQNARGTYLGELAYGTGYGGARPDLDVQVGLLRDNQHISFGIGRYIAGVIMAETLIPEAMRKDSYSWPGVKDSPAIGMLPVEYTEIAHKAVEAALETPYAVTVIPGYDTDPADAEAERIGSHSFASISADDETALAGAIAEEIQILLEKDGFAEPVVELEHAAISADGSQICFNGTVTVRYGYTTREVPIARHVDSSAVTAPTCTEQGYTTHTCTLCGGSYKDTFVDALGHSLGAWSETRVPTETEAGEEVRACTRCDHTETRSVDGVWRKYALSDHLQQLPENLCCGVNLWTALTPENDYHSGADWVGKYYSVTIPLQPGERLWSNAFGKAGTNGHSSTNGIHITFFGIYGVVKTMPPAETYSEFAANGYITAPEGTIAVNVGQWNENAAGELYILNLPHAYSAVVTAPTCTEQGYTTHTCACGESYTDSEVQELGHKPGDSVRENETATGYDAVVYCTACGEELSREYVQTYLPGDINGDGKVNNKDASRLFQYLSDWDVTVVEAALDVNGDGKVNNKDATRLFQYLSGWNVEIH